MMVAWSIVVTLVLTPTPFTDAQPAPGPKSSTSTSTGKGDAKATSSSTTTESEDSTPIELRPATVVIDDDPRVDVSLSAIALDGADYIDSVTDYLATFDKVKQAVDRHGDAVNRFNLATTALGDLLTARNRVQGQHNSAARRLGKAEARLAETRAKLRGLAVDQYVRGGLGGAPETAFDLSQADEAGRQRVLIQSVHHDQLIDQRLTTEVRNSQATLADTTAAELDGVSARIRTEEANRDVASNDRDSAERERTALLPELALKKRAVADARLTADIEGLDFTLVVLNAYVRAAKTLAVEQPGCGLRWSALAGIGRTESKHGTFDGATVDADGNETKPIYGIALNGENGTAVIHDTDDGELDDFAEGDRATGPMQFIPGSWRSVQRDGNSDGRSDPQNYYDAALTAGVYLCRKGPGLDADDGLRRAFRSYNNSDEYVELVLRRTHDYHRIIFPTVPKVDGGDPFRVPLPTTTATTTTTAPRPSRATAPPG